MTAEKCVSSSTGTDEGGVCILSKLPVQPVQMSGNVLFEGLPFGQEEKETRHSLRSVCVDAGQARQLQYDLFLELRRLGEDCLALRD